MILIGDNEKDTLSLACTKKATMVETIDHHSKKLFFLLVKIELVQETLSLPMIDIKHPSIHMECNTIHIKN